MKLIFFLLTAGVAIAQTPPVNWAGNYAPCNRHNDLVKRDPADLGVRISTSNPVLARQFQLAMGFWASVLDTGWHRVENEDCSIQVVDGPTELFESADGCDCISARSQFPDRPAFEGWVAFNSRVKLSEREMFLVSVHEIGHLLGLPHNPDGSSVMFFLSLSGPVLLDSADLNALADKHTLRQGIRSGVEVTAEKVSISSRASGASRSRSRGIAGWARPVRSGVDSGRVRS